MFFGPRMMRQPWSPADLGADLARWFKADSLSQADGSAVSAWPDSAGIANLSQATSARRPTYETNEINGLPVVRFVNASQQWMSGSASGLPTGSGGRAVFGVVKPADASTRSPLTSYGSSAARNRMFDTEYNTFSRAGALGLHAFDNGRVTTSTAAVAGGTTQLTGWTYPTGGQIQNAAIYHNGTSEATEQMRYVGGSATDVLNTASGTDLYVGSRVLVDLFASFDVGEIIMLSVEPTTSIRQRIEGYLAHKWGLASLLDSSHPYKTSPP